VSIAGRQLQNALRGFVRGGAQTWKPEVTTRSLADAETLQNAIDALRGSGKGRYYNANMFVQEYDGAVLPDADDPVWVEMRGGDPEAAVSGSVLTITDDAAAEFLYYGAADATLSNAAGTWLEARVQITDATGLAANRGSALAIHDGAYQFTVWLRSDGFNIDNEAHVDLDFTSWRRVRFVAKGKGCQLFVDGALRQTGSYMNESAKQLVTFGSWADAYQQYQHRTGGDVTVEGGQVITIV
jgi:hypothetical protein